VLAAVLPALGWAAPAQAQGVPWRYDYALARKEATEQNRPLIVDIGHEACFWCRQLDRTTFTEEAVARQVSEGFIPLRVDTARSPYLAEYLRIRNFPTVVFAAADGTILHVVRGYVDAAEMSRHIAYAQARLRRHETGER
jgi:thioredoxin-related protein